MRTQAGDALSPGDALSRRRFHSLLMPASAISFPHFTLSVRMNAANFSGEQGAGSAPRTRIFSAATGSFKAFTNAAFSRLIMSGGVPAGATRPNHPTDSKSLRPSSDERRHVRQKRDAFGRRDAERLQLAVLDQLLRGRDIQHRKRNVSRQHVHRRRRGAAIRDQLNVDSGPLGEQCRGEMHRGAVAAMSQ